MLKYVVFLLFLYGVKNVSSDSSNSQEKAVETKDASKNGIKKNEVGANGLEANWERVTRNFRNPVLEYLLQKNSDRAVGPPQKGIIREIRHSQTLLIPNFLGGPLPQLLINQLPQFESFGTFFEGALTDQRDFQSRALKGCTPQLPCTAIHPQGYKTQKGKKPVEQETRNPDLLPFENFWNFLKNKSQPGGSELQEKVVSSPVLHLNKIPEIKSESTKIQVYPAVAVVINTFDKDGSLKNSVTHFQPDFDSLRPQANEKEAIYVTGEKNANKNNRNNNEGHHTVSNFVREAPGHGPRQEAAPRQGISWPFANYFPIVINDPFLSVYNAFATSMYNAVSSMVEYGPEADICRKEHGRTVDVEVTENGKLNDEVKQLRNPSKLKDFDRLQMETTDGNVFDEVTMQSENYKRTNEKPPFVRERRDATSIFIKSREGDTVSVTLEQPKGSNGNERKREGSDLIIRKGGVAIAGPGGVATAYTGGTAIVGPYGTVYKSPEGTAILGPFSKVVNITDDTTFEEIIKMHKEMQSQTPNWRPTEANQQKGDVGFKNYRNFFSYKTNLPIQFELKPQGRSFVKNGSKIMRLKEEGIVRAIEEIKKAEFKRIVQDTPTDRQVAKGNETVLVFRPKSKAEAGRNGVALSAPTSHAILFPGQTTNIYFEPESVASAGPSGFAHAHSDLFVTYLRNNETTPSPERRGRSFKTIFLKKRN